MPLYETLLKSSSSSKKNMHQDQNDTLNDSYLCPSNFLSASQDTQRENIVASHISNQLGGGGGENINDSYLIEDNFSEKYGYTISKTPYNGKVYRGDDRGPNDIFNFGFTAQGFNKNLSDHLSYQPYEDKKSILISTTKSKNTAVHYAFGFLGDAKKSGYIYKIYNPKNHVNIADFVHPDNAVLSNAEVAIFGKIQPECIKGAYELKRKEDGSIKKVRYIRNKKFGNNSN